MQSPYIIQIFQGNFNVQWSFLLPLHITLLSHIYAALRNNLIWKIQALQEEKSQQFYVICLFIISI